MKNPFALGFTAALVALLALGASYLGPWAPSPFTQQIGTNTTASAWRTALSVTNATGGEALLAGTNTLTGTNTFSGQAVFSNSMLSVDGFYPPLRLLYRHPTNIYVAALVTNTAAAVETNGGSPNSLRLWSGTLPGLIGSNSTLLMWFTIVRPQANAGGGQTVIYAGPNTNYIGIGSTVFGTTRSILQSGFSPVLSLDGSFTSQSGSSSWAQGTASLLPIATNILGDSRNPFYFQWDAYETAGNTWTNGWITGLAFYELVK